jgi:hypothetical protein
VDPSVLEWLAIGLALVAVVVILRYASRPRCELCDRRHHIRMIPARTVEQPWPAEHHADLEWTTISWRAESWSPPRQPHDSDH